MKDGFIKQENTSPKMPIVRRDSEIQRSRAAPHTKEVVSRLDKSIDLVVPEQKVDRSRRCPTSQGLESYLTELLHNCERSPWLTRCLYRRKCCEPPQEVAASPMRGLGLDQAGPQARYSNGRLTTRRGIAASNPWPPVTKGRKGCTIFGLWRTPMY